MSIEQYLTEMKSAWSPSTHRSESSRLRRVSLLIQGQNTPGAAWGILLSHYNPYAASTAFTRWLEYKRWRSDKDVGEWEKYRKKHKFGRRYQRHLPQLSFAEAKECLAKLSPETRRKALELLYTGLRYSEYEKVEGQEVVGKGNKRRVLVGKVSGVKVKDKEFRKELKRVGLKPHDLRKIFATELARKGMSVFDLCAVMGWSGLNTAQSYVSAAKDLKGAVHELVGEI